MVGVIQLILIPRFVLVFDSMIDYILYRVMIKGKNEYTRTHLTVAFLEVCSTLLFGNTCLPAFLSTPRKSAFRLVESTLGDRGFRLETSASHSNLVA